MSDSFIVIAIGVAIVFVGLWPGVRFHQGYYGIRLGRRVPTWLGRVVFLVVGMAFIYMGVQRMLGK